MTKAKSDDTTPRQGTLPADGMARKKIAAVEEAAMLYLKTRDKRMQLTTKEKETKDALLDVLKKHADKLPKNGKGQAVYAFENEDGEERFAVLDEKFNVKVRKAAQDDDDDE